MGNEKKVITYIFNCCKKTGARVTPPISLETMLNSLDIKSTGILKTVIHRLIKKGALYVELSKKGRGGWSQYAFPDKIYQEIFLYSQGEEGIQIDNKQITNGQQIDNKWVTQKVTNPSSSSSYINNKEITNTSNGLNESFQEVQIPNILKDHKFGIHIIKQVQDREYLTADELQESFNFFAFDINTNSILTSKNVNDARSYFMGIIKNKSIYAPPSNYLSDEEKAQQENLKRLQELKKKREEKEKLLFDLGYEEWLSNLTEEEKLEIAPPMSGKFGLGTAFHNQQLKSYYEQNQDKI